MAAFGYGYDKCCRCKGYIYTASGPGHHCECPTEVIEVRSLEHFVKATKLKTLLAQPSPESTGIKPYSCSVKRHKDFNARRI